MEPRASERTLQPGGAAQLKAHDVRPSMYDVPRRAKDAVSVLTDVPAPEVGAPCPRLLASEGALALAYFYDVPVPPGEPACRPSGEPSDRAMAVVTFERPRAHIFGPPNDEALDGHPLFARGLQPYTAHVVEPSSWLRLVERRNAVHRHHRKELFAQLRHYAFVFHDTTFECLAVGHRFTRAYGDVHAALASALSGAPG